MNTGKTLLTNAVNCVNIDLLFQLRGVILMSHVAKNYVYVAGEKKTDKPMPQMSKEQMEAAKNAVAKYLLKK